jgi:hypothetical protein
MSQNNLTARLTALKNKTAELTVQEVKVPDSSANILDLYQGNSSARADSANEWIIDVFPNMVPILMYVMLMSSQHAGLTDHRNHAKTSVATIALYHMAIVYGFFLLNDLYVRPSPSAHARSWSQTSWKNEFVTFLLTLPVPEFLEPILAQFHACQTERTGNVFFIPSAAGFSHEHFFGRFIPLNFFSEIHDCTSTLPGNSSRIAVLQDLLSRRLYTLTSAGINRHVLIPDFLGITIDQTIATTAHFFNSRFYQIFNSTFNPVLFRDYQRRSTLASLNLKAPSHTTLDPNAYDILFAASSSNLRELRVVLQAVASVLTPAVSCKKTLSHFISGASGSAILKHAYSEYALPVMSSNRNVTNATTFPSITHLTAQTESERATDISFLQPANGTPATAVHDVIYQADAAPGTPVAIPGGHSIARYWPWSLRYTRTQATHWPRTGTDNFVSFSDELHTAPRTLVLDTDATKTITAHLVTLTGKVIESFEIDGTTVEMPNALKSLGMQNCLFADSAIPYKYCLFATKWYPRTASSITAPLARVKPNSQPRLPASSLLHDRLTIMLPQVNTSVVDTTLPTTLPGMTQRPNATWLKYAQSFLGFRTVDGSSNVATRDQVPGMETGRLMVWSPYTFTPYEDDDEPLPALSESRHYFLTNLRSLFGTDYNLIEVKHSFEAMPVV